MSLTVQVRLAPTLLNPASYTPPSAFAPCTSDAVDVPPASFRVFASVLGRSTLAGDADFDGFSLGCTDCEPPDGLLPASLPSSPESLLTMATPMPMTTAAPTATAPISSAFVLGPRPRPPPPRIGAVGGPGWLGTLPPGIVS